MQGLDIGETEICDFAAAELGPNPFTDLESGIVLEVAVPKGSKGAPAGSETLDDKEAEILIKSGSRLRIVDITKDNLVKAVLENE